MGKNNNKGLTDSSDTDGSTPNSATEIKPFTDSAADAPPQSSATQPLAPTAEQPPLQPPSDRDGPVRARHGTASRDQDRSNVVTAHTIAATARQDSPCGVSSASSGDSKVNGSRSGRRSVKRARRRRKGRETRRRVRWRDKPSPWAVYDSVSSVLCDEDICTRLCGQSPAWGLEPLADPCRFLPGCHARLPRHCASCLSLGSVKSRVEAAFLRPEMELALSSSSASSFCGCCPYAVSSSVSTSSSAESCLSRALSQLHVSSHGVSDGANSCMAGCCGLQDGRDVSGNSCQSARPALSSHGQSGPFPAGFNPGFVSGLPGLAKASSFDGKLGGALRPRNNNIIKYTSEVDCPAECQSSYHEDCGVTQLSTNQTIGAKNTVRASAWSTIGPQATAANQSTYWHDKRVPRTSQSLASRKLEEFQHDSWGVDHLAVSYEQAPKDTDDSMHTKQALTARAFQLEERGPVSDRHWDGNFLTLSPYDADLAGTTDLLGVMSAFHVTSCLQDACLELDCRNVLGGPNPAVSSHSSACCSATVSADDNTGSAGGESRPGKQFVSYSSLKAAHSSNNFSMPTSAAYGCGLTKYFQSGKRKHNSPVNNISYKGKNVCGNSQKSKIPKMFDIHESLNDLELEYYLNQNWG